MASTLDKTYLLKDEQLQCDQFDFFRELLSHVNDSYHILFGSGLINHSSQTLVALAQLGASPDRLHQFLEAYRVDTGYGTLTPVHDLALPTDPLPPLDLAELIPAYLARFQSALPSQDPAVYRTVVRFWESQLSSTPLPLLLPKVWPLLGFNFFGAAFHPLIQLGLGAKTRCQRTIAEGLALGGTSPPLFSGQDASFPAFLPPRPSRSLLDTIERVRNEAWDFSQCAATRFPPRLSHLLSDPATLSRLLELVACCDLTEDPLRAIEFAGAAAYAGNFSLGCDFFLLHAITSFWALKPLLSLCEHDAALRSQMLQSYMLCFLAAYIVRHHPVPVTHLPDDGTPLDLDALHQRAVASNDEHVSKLVAALFEAADATADLERKTFYFRVIRHSLDHLPTPQSYYFA